MSIKVIVNGKEHEVGEDTRYDDIVHLSTTEYAPILARSNNLVVDMSRRIGCDSTIEFLDVTSEEGYLGYQRSVSFMAYVAVKKVLGYKARFFVKHSISKNFTCEVENLKLTAEDVLNIKNEMLRMVKNKAKITRDFERVDYAQKKLIELNNPTRVSLLQYEPQTTCLLYMLDGYVNFFYDSLASSCEHLGVFDLVPFNDGFRIMFPERDEPTKVMPYSQLKVIEDVFTASAKWTKILGVTNAGDLNEVICNNKIENLIKVNEALHEKRLAEIADMAVQSNAKMVLIAGPSSSGKTTFSKRLCVHLEVIGKKPIVLGMDDFYKERDEIPFEANGRQNFESVDALEVELINDTFSRLVEGEEVEVPHFNFTSGKKEWKGKKIKLDGDSIIVVEGIHGLNERLTKSVPQNEKFKIFISALTQINVDDINRISTRDSRLIRRIVRDHKFRGTTALKTISMWEDVLKGENEYIFPYQKNADVVFNSSLVYELSILKVYAMPILLKVTPDQAEYSECRRLIKFLNNFISVPVEAVPTNSLVREFVGGSSYE